MPDIILRKGLYCRCTKCSSILRYENKEINVKKVLNTKIKYLYCPACTGYFVLEDDNKIDQKDLIKEMAK